VAGQRTESGRQGSQRVILLATYVVLAAIGVLLGVIEAFLVPLRLFDGVEGLSAVLALLANLMVALLGGIGTRSSAGVVAPVAGWFVAVGVLSVVAPGGDVVLAGKLPADPGVVTVGMAFLIAGVIAGAIALVVTVRYTKRQIAPTPQA
jgi:hypothetical protein